MDNKLTPRAKRLLVIAMLTPGLIVIDLCVTPMLNSQRRHLISVKEHISKIDPQWERFLALHPGFQDVHLFAYTGGDGMFGAYGLLSSNEQVVDLRKFMESTVPPRPIYLGSVHFPGAEESAPVAKTPGHK